MVVASVASVGAMVVASVASVASVVVSVAGMGDLMVDMAAAELGWEVVVEVGVAFKHETVLVCNLEYNGSRH